MSEKRFNGRIVNKHDIEANWLKATNFIPMQGEAIVYDVDENHNHERIKIGDGITNVNDLPFYAGSWNDLEDKPFYVEDDPSITFDGNTEGLTVLDLSDSWGVVYYKISDYTPELSQVMGQRFSDTSREYVVTEDLVDPYCAEPAYMIGYSYLVVPEDNCAISEDKVVAEKGLYAGSNITYIGISPKTKHIDEKYIPDTIARVEDVPVIEYFTPEDIDIICTSYVAAKEVLF